jgi:hypothetical protein
MTPQQPSSAVTPVAATPVAATPVHAIPPKTAGRQFGWRREAIIDVYNAMLGIVLAVSPWLFGFSRDIARADAWVSAAIVIAVSLMAIIAFAEWKEWTNIIAGLWLVASPWLLGFPHTRAMHVVIGVGLLIAYDAALELWVVRTHYAA